MLVCVGLAIYFFALVGKEEKRLMAEHRTASTLS